MNESEDTKRIREELEAAVAKDHAAYRERLMTTPAGCLSHDEQKDLIRLLNEYLFGDEQG